MQSPKTSSFSFPFLVEFPEEKDNLGYLLHAYDNEAGFAYGFGKIIEPEDTSSKRETYFAFPDFTIKEMVFLVGFLMGYCEGIFPYIKKYFEEEFVHRVGGSRIYGHKDGEFFDVSRRDSKDWDSIVAKYDA